MVLPGFPSAFFAVAVLAFIFTLAAGPVHAQDATNRTFMIAMPACPIEATTVAPTKRAFTLPGRSPLLPLSAAGTIQVADQTGGVIFKVTVTAGADPNFATFTRTVNT